MKAVESYVLQVTDTPPTQLAAALRRLAGPEAGESIMSTAEKLLAEGMAKGKLEDRAETLLRLLRRRFGDLPAAIEQRVRSATIARLDLWTDRILDAATLDDVLSET
jgi:hypothetical protein